MLDLAIRELLLEAASLLASDDPPVAPWRRAGRERIASQLRRVAAAGGSPGCPLDIAEQAELRWSRVAGVRLVKPVVCRVGDDGTWVAAWLRASPALPPDIAPAEFDAVLGRLPVVTREVFLLHRRDGLDFTTISSRLAIGLAEVERHLATALAALSRAFRER